jgi:hypothetical protein
MLHSRLDVCCVFAPPSSGQALKITPARSRAAGTQERLHVLEARLDVCSILAPLCAVLTTSAEDALPVSGYELRVLWQSHERFLTPHLTPHALQPASNPIHLFLSRGHPGAVVSFVAALSLRV